jgi:hypothetical protein
MFGACSEEFNFPLYARSVGSIDGVHRPATVYMVIKELQQAAKAKFAAQKQASF